MHHISCLFTQSILMNLSKNKNTPINENIGRRSYAYQTDGKIGLLLLSRKRSARTWKDTLPSISKPLFVNFLDYGKHLTDKKKSNSSSRSQKKRDKI